LSSEQTKNESTLVTAKANENKSEGVLLRVINTIFKFPITAVEDLLEVSIDEVSIRKNDLQWKENPINMDG